MKTMAMADYYVWYCEWCDSRNLTPWSSATSGKVCCGGCHREFPVSGAPRPETQPRPRQVFSSLH